jgi:hypothetical protein
MPAAEIFHKFKQWHGFHNLKLCEERGGADDVAASNENLKLLRKEGTH